MEFPANWYTSIENYSHENRDAFVKYINNRFRGGLRGTLNYYGIIQGELEGSDSSHSLRGKGTFLTETEVMARLNQPISAPSSWKVLGDTPEKVKVLQHIFRTKFGASFADGLDFWWYCRTGARGYIAYSCVTSYSADSISDVPEMSFDQFVNTFNKQTNMEMKKNWCIQLKKSKDVVAFFNKLSGRDYGSVTGDDYAHYPSYNTHDSYSAPHPMNGYRVITIEEFREITTQGVTNSDDQIITRLGLKEIYDIACASWKSKLQSWAARNPFEETVTLTVQEVKSMFEAANDKQKQTLVRYLKLPNEDKNVMLKVNESTMNSVNTKLFGEKDVFSVFGNNTELPELKGRAIYVNSNYTVEATVLGTGATVLSFKKK